MALRTTTAPTRKPIMDEDGAMLNGEKHLKHKRRYCRAEGCVRIVKSQGLCQRHGAKPKKCKVEECTKQAQGNFCGMCKLHYKALSQADHAQETKTASPLKVPSLVLLGDLKIIDRCLPALKEWDSNQEPAVSPASVSVHSMPDYVNSRGGGSKSTAMTAAIANVHHYDVRNNDYANNEEEYDNDDDDVQPLNMWEEQPDPSELDAECLEELAATLALAAGSHDIGAGETMHSYRYH